MAQILLYAVPVLIAQPQVAHGGHIAALGGGPVELHGPGLVLGHAVAGEQQIPQNPLGPRELLLYRLFQPAYGLLRAPFRAGPVEQAYGQIGLGRGIALPGGLGVPVHRLGRVFGQSLP